MKPYVEIAHYIEPRGGAYYGVRVLGIEPDPITRFIRDKIPEIGYFVSNYVQIEKFIKRNFSDLPIFHIWPDL